MKMTVIAAPPRRHLVFISDRVPVLRSDGPSSFECGACNTLLIAAMREQDAAKAAIRCPTCGAYNIVLEHA